MGFGGRLTTRLAWQFAESSTVKSTAVRPALDPTARRPTKLLKRLAGGLGFEPRLAESESAVLPLDDPPSAGPRSPRHRRIRRHYHPDTTLARGCVGGRARHYSSHWHRCGRLVRSTARIGAGCLGRPHDLPAPIAR